MRIAICVNRLTGGGAERVSSLWIQGLVRMGYEVSIIISSRHEPINYSIPDKTPIYKIDSKFSNRYVRVIHNLLIKPLCLRFVLKKINPEVVISVMSDWIPLIDKVCPRRNFKLISTEHNAFEFPVDAIIPSNLFKLKYEANKKADLVTVLTEADKRCIGNKLSNVVVLPNPLTFKPVDDIPKKENVILAVGRLDGWYVKGFDILIKAWSSISYNFPTWKLQIIGEGKNINKERLIHMCRDLNISNSVDFVGFTDPLPYYSKASVFVLSSRYEGFGMVLIEAMSQGCACIACDWKGRQKEIITNEQEGIICMPDSIQELAQSIKTMINDSTYRRLVQEQAVIRSKVFEPEAIMKKWQDIIENISSR